jgi:hypothetical protein
MTPDRFAIIPVSHGPAPADAIVVGSYNEVMEYIPQSVARQDAVEQLEKARFTADQIASMQQKTRGVQATMLCDSLSLLSARLDSFLERRADAARARAKADEEEEQQRIQDELASLPDPDDPGAHDAALPGDPFAPSPGIHENTGDLHSLPAKLPDQAGDPSKGEMETPEPNAPEPKGSVNPQPTAVQLW